MGSVIRSSSLRFKVIFVTSFILIVAISFSAWLNIRFREDSLKRLTYEKAKIISEYIEKNVIRAMEKGRHYDMQKILKNFSAYKGVSKITLFRPDGTVKASTAEDDVPKDVGEIASFLKNQHLIRNEITRGKDGNPVSERVYYLIAPIWNKSECHECHDSKQAVVGIMAVANSLTEMDEEISKIKRNSIAIAIVTIGFLSSVLALLFLKFVNRPIQKLTSAMRRVEEGDLSARVDLEGGDEMGRLAASLNKMIARLGRARREAEEYHQQLMQRADRMASIGELASGIAHEVRNPLAGIQGAIQILAEGFQPEDSRRQVTDEIEKQIRKMERLVKDLLSYAKPVPSHYLPADINDVAQKVLSFFLNQRGISEGFKVEKSFSSLPKTLIDPYSIEQAFLNIVLNAQKAMPDGGTLKVSTSSIKRANNGEERDVQIAFEDSGVGIPKENIPKIFNPFFSTRSDGTGLGLSITKHIIDLHEGRIDVESQLQRGTKFVITLPAMKEHTPLT